ncbi:ABC transporter ATP-binding protein [Gimesia fumaroli]|uniref:Putative ABC transporter ATP-binding protein n=1 Tax=Gimesia fumaroli TaxID=2527976 RepID=A0A518IKH1_9PLAN|nr:ABC transporter ATP-binding protein [Gimesia fumaroli]QDV53564.1 putative ABC transporter ATP-binding protein [Gimesia fumaroli]
MPAPDADALQPHTPGESPVLLSLKSISKTYIIGDVSVPVLHHVDLEIYDGEFLVVVGPSGSGKSTLLNIVGGIDLPTEGSVFFQNQNISQFNEQQLTRYRRENIGFVFQFYNLVPTLTARENVIVAADISESPMSPDDALELVGLSSRVDHFPSQLSGGEQQRVAIARALVKNPELLLCDEPTGALDLTTGRMILEVLGNLNRELGKTVVIITHNSAIGQMAQRIVRIGSGTIAETNVNPHPIAAQQVTW